MAVSLKKGQRISLDKEAGRGLKRIVMGLGWDAAKRRGIAGWLFGGTRAIDLDASCLLFDASGELVDAVWFRQLKSKDGSIVHTGDNRTGDGDGDDEQIIVDLTALPANVKTLVFTVNSFTGQTFEEVENAYCRIVDQSNQEEIARYTLSVQGAHTAQVMAKVVRDGQQWQMEALGENGSGRTFQELMPIIRPILA